MAKAIADQQSAKANESHVANRPSELPRVQPSSRAAWRRWLEKHRTTSGAWLVFAKKGAGIPSLTYNDAVEEALCFGWIDSRLQPLDDALYMQLFTPRRPKSGWSATNKERVARLIEAGLMTKAGLEQIAIAKATGAWTTHDAVHALEIPRDLQRALAANPRAKAGFETFSTSAKKRCLYRLSDAKRPETRARRLGEILRAAETGRLDFTPAPAPGRARAPRRR